MPIKSVLHVAFNESTSGLSDNCGQMQSPESALATYLSHWRKTGRELPPGLPRDMADELIDLEKISAAKVNEALRQETETLRRDLPNTE